MTRDEAKALARLVTSGPRYLSSDVDERHLRSFALHGLIDVDEFLFVEPNRDAALRALAAFVLEDRSS